MKFPLKLWALNFFHVIRRWYSTIATTVWTSTRRFWGHFCDRLTWSWSCQNETGVHVEGCWVGFQHFYWNWSTDTSCTSQSSGQLRVTKLFDHYFDDFEVNFFKFWRATWQPFHSVRYPIVLWTGKVTDSPVCRGDGHCHHPRNMK